MSSRTETGDGVTGKQRGLRADAKRNQDRILRVAVQHFAANGINASLEEIARAAGVGPGTLYRHFPSREALLDAVLKERKSELLARAEVARRIEDADVALRQWLEALHDYLRTFNGLPAPVAAALKEQDSPLAVSCHTLAAITDDFLTRAQHHGHARPSVKAYDLLLIALGLAWASDQAGACTTSREAIEEILAHGYLSSAPRPHPATESGSPASAEPEQ